MPFTLTMPKLSPTMEEGQIVRWHKKIGDRVEAGDLLLEVATDKATVEHSALDEGWVKKILVPEGEMAHINQPIAIFTAEENESIEGYQAEGDAAQEPIAQTAVEKKEEILPQKNERVKTNENERIVASPLARRLAKEKNLDLSGMIGSGPRGRIMSRDLEAASASAGGYREEKMTPMRKAIATRLQEAKQSIPHFYVTSEIDAGAMVDLRDQLGSGHVKISYNDMILHASALALKEHPVINSGFNASASTVIRFETVDIAVAVSLPQGLITPIVRDADKKNLTQISDEVRALASRAREGKLKEEEYKGGSFTISNLGMYDVKEFVAIINPPQAAILAVGSILPKVFVKEGNIVAGHSLTLTLSSDHRVIDGVAAAKFLQTLKKLLENPALLVV